jgi:hypothetical protein
MSKSLLPPVRFAEAMGFSAREADKGNEQGPGACGQFRRGLGAPSFFPWLADWPGLHHPHRKFASDDLPLPGILPCVPHDFTYISLGAGVQSTALVILSVQGLHGCPRADVRPGRAVGRLFAGRRVLVESL